MHDLMGFLFVYWILRAGKVFKAHDHSKLTSKYGFVKGKGFFGIPVEVDVRIDKCHNGNCWFSNLLLNHNIMKVGKRQKRGGLRQSLQTAMSSQIDCLLNYTG
jgi:hypothetical protein